MFSRFLWLVVNFNPVNSPHDVKFTVYLYILKFPRKLIIDVTVTPCAFHHSLKNAASQTSRFCSILLDQ